MFAPRSSHTSHRCIDLEHTAVFHHRIVIMALNSVAARHKIAYLVPWNILLDGRHPAAQTIEQNGES